MAETKLRVVSAYRNRDIQYGVGDVITVDEALAKWLRADAPGCFEEYVETKAPTAPAENKMIASAPKRKTTRKVDLNSMFVTELKEMARERGIAYSGLSKAELIEALS